MIAIAYFFVGVCVGAGLGCWLRRRKRPAVSIHPLKPAPEPQITTGRTPSGVPVEFGTAFRA